MKCFYCGYFKTIVVDSRGKENFSKVMRRRCCPKCRKRATTFEMSNEAYETTRKVSSDAHLTKLCQSLDRQLCLLEAYIKLVNPEFYRK